jgi:hypothetical protein
MAAMVVRIDVEAIYREPVGEAAIARRMLGKAVVDLHNSASRFGRFSNKKIQPCAGLRMKNALLVERHRRPSREEDYP